MADISATEAAFTGFRVVREHPAAAAVWAALLFLISIGFGFVVTTTSGPALMRFVDLQASGALNAAPQKVLPLMGQLGPVFATLGALALVVYPILFAAMNRAALRPDQSRFGYLRLGADELRQLGLIVIGLALFLSAYFFLLATAVMGGALASLVLASAGPQLSGGGAALVLAAALVGGVCALVFFGVRLSLAPALTFATGKVNLAGAWTMTRGRFWQILGAYLLAVALATLVGSLVFALNAAAVAVVGGGMPALDAALRPDLTSPATYFSPTRFVYLALSAISSALIWPLAMTPAATIYRRLAPSFGFPTGSEGSVFDILV